MKGTGNAIISKVADTRFSRMEAFIKGNMWMGNLKELANTLGQMASPTRASGSMA